GNNAEASGNASRQAQQAEHVVGLDGSGGLGVGKVLNAYGSGVGVVIGLSVIGGQRGHVGVSVGSQSSSPSRWKKRRVQTQRLSPQKNSYSTCKSTFNPFLSSSDSNKKCRWKRNG
ncbi:hypothetical protein Tco_1036779, partial [Tanacetum coccineum]